MKDLKHVLLKRFFIPFTFLWVIMLQGFEIIWGLKLSRIRIGFGSRSPYILDKIRVTLDSPHWEGRHARGQSCDETNIKYVYTS